MEPIVQGCGVLGGVAGWMVAWWAGRQGCGIPGWVDGVSRAAGSGQLLLMLGHWVGGLLGVWEFWIWASYNFS